MLAWTPSAFLVVIYWVVLPVGGMMHLLVDPSSVRIEGGPTVYVGADRTGNFGSGRAAQLQRTDAATTLKG